jgi:hypothetical protein
MTVSSRIIAYLTIAISLLSFASLVRADDAESLPSSVAEASSRIIRDMSEEDKVMFVRMAERELIQFHFGLGMGIRNSFGLWGKNDALLSDCGEDIHPDDCSHVIIKRVWSELFNSMDRSYWEKEQRTHAALSEVRVDPSDYQNRTAGGVLSQLRNDLSRSEFFGADEITLTNRCTEQEPVIPRQRLDVDWGSPIELIAWTSSEMGCRTSVVESTVFIEPPKEQD